jgi:hypothetical protein
VIELDPHALTFTVTESARIHGDSIPSAQGAESVSSLSVGTDAQDMTILTPRPLAPGGAMPAPVVGNGLAIFDPSSGDLATITWPADGASSATVETKSHSILARVTCRSPHPCRTVYGYLHADDDGDAQRTLSRLSLATR